MAEEEPPDRTSTPAVAGVVTIAIVAVYFGLFGLLMLDDLVLGRVIYHHAPEPFIEAVRFIYRPLVALFRLG
jgi:hypothetical protein